MTIDYSCRCGKKFRSYAAEARHRHNFPALCWSPAKYHFAEEGGRTVTVTTRNGLRDAERRACNVLSRRSGRPLGHPWKLSHRSILRGDLEK